eukprot:TRINITY_DN2441_c1_g1_i2.p1 TRINITY_DN2441_c1_g1~~TRINITY_DN2441_c1_g1_i2.p1  ORF type:complete len:1993 (-),score=785.46 TRINITY_DN2441_c1_g1_i2:915-6893(-)
MKSGNWIVLIVIIQLAIDHGFVETIIYVLRGVSLSSNLAKASYRLLCLIASSINGAIAVVKRGAAKAIMRSAQSENQIDIPFAVIQLLDLACASQEAADLLRRQNVMHFLSWLRTEREAQRLPLSPTEDARYKNLLRKVSSDAGAIDLLVDQVIDALDHLEETETSIECLYAPLRQLCCVAQLRTNRKRIMAKDGNSVALRVADKLCTMPQELVESCLTSVVQLIGLLAHNTNENIVAPTVKAMVSCMQKVHALAEPCIQTLHSVCNIECGALAFAEENGPELVMSVVEENLEAKTTVVQSMQLLADVCQFEQLQDKVMSANAVKVAAQVLTEVDDLDLSMASACVGVIHPFVGQVQHRQLMTEMGVFDKALDALDTVRVQVDTVTSDTANEEEIAKVEETTSALEMLTQSVSQIVASNTEEVPETKLRQASKLCSIIEATPSLQKSAEVVEASLEVLSPCIQAIAETSSNENGKEEEQKALVPFVLNCMSLHGTDGAVLQLSTSMLSAMGQQKTVAKTLLSKVEEIKAMDESNVEVSSQICGAYVRGLAGLVSGGEISEDIAENDRCMEAFQWAHTKFSDYTKESEETADTTSQEVKSQKADRDNVAAAAIQGLANVCRSSTVSVGKKTEAIQVITNVLKESKKKRDVIKAAKVEKKARRQKLALPPGLSLPGSGTNAGAPTPEIEEETMTVTAMEPTDMSMTSTRPPTSLEQDLNENLDDDDDSDEESIDAVAEAAMFAVGSLCTDVEVMKEIAKEPEAISAIADRAKNDVEKTSCAADVISVMATTISCDAHEICEGSAGKDVIGALLSAGSIEGIEECVSAVAAEAGGEEILWDVLGSDESKGYESACTVISVLNNINAEKVENVTVDDPRKQAVRVERTLPTLVSSLKMFTNKAKAKQAVMRSGIEKHNVVHKTVVKEAVHETAKLIDGAKTMILSAEPSAVMVNSFVESGAIGELVAAMEMAQRPVIQKTNNGRRRSSVNEITNTDVTVTVTTTVGNSKRKSRRFTMMPINLDEAAEQLKKQADLEREGQQQTPSSPNSTSDEPESPSSQSQTIQTNKNVLSCLKHITACDDEATVHKVVTTLAQRRFADQVCSVLENNEKCKPETRDVESSTTALTLVNKMCSTLGIKDSGISRKNATQLQSLVQNIVDKNENVEEVAQATQCLELVQEFFSDDPTRLMDMQIIEITDWANEAKEFEAIISDDGVYYYNKSTEESSWTKPECIQSLDSALDELLEIPKASKADSADTNLVSESVGMTFAQLIATKGHEKHTAELLVKTLARLVTDKKSANAIVKGGCVPGLAILSKTLDGEILIPLMRIIEICTQETSNKPILLKAGLLGSLIDVLERNINELNVLVACLTTLVAMTFSMEMVVDVSIEPLLNVMSAQMESYALLDQCVCFISNLLFLADNLVTIGQAVAQHMVEIFTYLENPVLPGEDAKARNSLMKNLLHCLGNMSFHNDNTFTLVELGVTSAVIKAIEADKRTSSMLVAVEVLSNFAAMEEEEDADEDEDNFGGSQIEEAVETMCREGVVDFGLSMLSNEKDNVGIIKASLDLLRNLARFEAALLAICGKQDLFTVLSQIVHQHDFDAELVELAMTLIGVVTGCVEGLDLFPGVEFVDSILQTMASHEDTPAVLISAQTALTNLAEDRELLEHMQRDVVVHSVLNILKNQMDEFDFVAEAMSTLMLILESEAMCVEALPVLLALQRHLEEKVDNEEDEEEISQYEEVMAPILSIISSMTSLVEPVSVLVQMDGIELIRDTITKHPEEQPIVLNCIRILENITNTNEEFGQMIVESHCKSLVEEVKEVYEDDQDICEAAEDFVLAVNASEGMHRTTQIMQKSMRGKSKALHLLEENEEKIDPLGSVRKALTEGVKVYHWAVKKGKVSKTKDILTIDESDWHGLKVGANRVIEMEGGAQFESGSHMFPKKKFTKDALDINSLQISCGDIHYYLEFFDEPTKDKWVGILHQLSRVISDSPDELMP